MFQKLHPDAEHAILINYHTDLLKTPSVSNVFLRGFNTWQTWTNEVNSFSLITIWVTSKCKVVCPASCQGGFCLPVARSVVGIQIREAVLFPKGREQSNSLPRKYIFPATHSQQSKAHINSWWLWTLLRIHLHVYPILLYPQALLSRPQHVMLLLTATVTCKIKLQNWDRLNDCLL